MTIKLGNFTKLNTEFAQSTADTTRSYLSYNGGYDYTEVDIANPTDATALRIELNSSLGEYFGKEKGFLDFSGYWQRIDHNFSQPDSLFEAGTEKFGLGLSHQWTPRDHLQFLYEQGDLEKQADNPAATNQLQAKKIQHLTAQWGHKWNRFNFTTEYLYKDEKGSLSPIQDEGKGRVIGHIVGEKIQYELSDRTSVFVGQQLGLTDVGDSFTSAGFSRRITEDMSLQGQFGAGPMGNSVSGGVEKRVDRVNSLYSNYTLAHSAIDGKSSILSFGSNTQVSETASLTRERQFVTSDTRGVYASNLIGYEHQITPELAFDATYQRRDEKQKPLTLTSSEARDAATARVSYIVPDQFKVFSRAEHRLNSDNVWQILSDTQGEFKLTRDLFLFGEYEFSKAKKALSQIDKRQVGLAFRPVDYDWFNALFKYIFFIDHRPQNLGSADGGFMTTQSTSEVLAGEAAIDLPWRLQYVPKLAWKDEEIIAINPTNTTRTPEDLQAFLWIHRLNYHLTDRWDVAFEYRTLKQEGSSNQTKESGLLFELTYQIVKHIAVGAGFNFTDFTDDLLAPDNKNARGFFLRLQGKY